MFEMFKMHKICSRCYRSYKQLNTYSDGKRVEAPFKKMFFFLNNLKCHFTSNTKVLMN